ncbi:toxin-antitoxin system YwqK family antitoxin [Carboxylicivirga sp. M1479]|uniref:toxin-antitoxin system YwqK family antitoxin n=1 Tax=Carboxylicivirga sp. M1479 TaxID=2594476 RepID=UPI00163DB8EC|nr:toxin-antitoxin system YwqK family antitoxin [Carboxylicivirga sp. M1479]
MQQGLLCGITSQKADFETSCDNFERDEFVQDTVHETSNTDDQPLLQGLSSNILDKLRGHQDFYYALIGGLLATLISGVLWAVVTVSTEYQIGYMAIGVGLIVGYSVRFFGAGIDQHFGYLGAFLSLLGCLLGNLFTQVGFYAHEQSLSYLEVLSYLDLTTTINVLTESFSPIDVLFYGIALFQGYKLAFRRVSELEIKLIQEGTTEAYPPNYKLRMPLVAVSIIAIGTFLITVNNGVSGYQTYHYESGNIMSEGELVNSKEEGKWTYWYENGNTQLIAHYNEGTPDSVWQWFNDQGKLVTEGFYKLGLEDGIWINYHENGIQQDSGRYENGRMTGLWKSWYTNSQLLQEGLYNRSLQEGLWLSYHENGKLASEGQMKENNATGQWKIYSESGDLESIITHESPERLVIENVWDEHGQQLVKDGNGTFYTYYASGQVLATGQVKDGLKSGKWLSYFENGQVQEEGIYKADAYTITNSWYNDGRAGVTDGNGFYQSYYLGDEKIHESGQVTNGLREGTWHTYYETSQTVYQECNYHLGKQTGEVNVYFETGELYANGLMKNNVREGEWNWYYANGLLSSTATFVEDKKDGKQTMWSEVGELTKEEYYDHGKLTDQKLF